MHRRYHYLWLWLQPPLEQLVTFSVMAKKGGVTCWVNVCIPWRGELKLNSTYSNPDISKPTSSSSIFPGAFLLAKPGHFLGAQLLSLEPGDPDRRGVF